MNSAEPPSDDSAPAAPRRSGWTGERVGERLVDAFRELRHISVFSPDPEHLTPATPTADRHAIRLLELTARYLPAHGSDRMMLLTWARAMSMPREVRPSERDICREMGWSRSSFRRSRETACARIADGLNRDSVSA